MAGLAGWLTGKLIGKRGYRKALKGYASNGLDVVLGIVGAAIGGYLFLWAVIGQGGSLSKYGVAILGSVTLVGIARLVSARYLPSSSRLKTLSHTA
jgi:uncharacterized membrane protein YeaQ/YmgE (transglycosylase-associated protein family)